MPARARCAPGARMMKIIRTVVFAGWLLASSFPAPGQTSSVASENARKSPEFLNRSVIYQIWMRSFTPEGTLYATATHLPYIADLGVDIIYLSPLNVHGY